MRGNRVFVVFSMVLLLSVLMSGVVSAATIGEDITKSVDKYFVEPVNAVLKYLVGDSVTGAAAGDSGKYMLVKFLALIIIFSLAYAGAKRTPGLQENGFVAFIVSLIIGILGARYLTSKELVEFLWLPTGVFGVVVMALLPFVIFFFLIESFDSRVIRKVGWIAFAVIFFALSVYRWGDLAAADAAWWENLGWAYLIIAILSLLAVYFDKKLRAKFVLSSMGHQSTKSNMVSAANFMESIDDQVRVRDRAIKDGDAKTQKAAEKEIDRLQKEVAKLK